MAIQSEKQPFSIFIDSQPILTNNLIFDQMYKNASDKKKYHNNRQYAYFNTLIKLKKQLHAQHKQSSANSNQSSVYKYTFQKVNKELPLSSNNNRKNYDESLARGFRSEKKVLHVEKVNKNIYKIHKNGLLNGSRDPNRQSEVNPNNISFHLHFKPNERKKREETTQRMYVQTANNDSGIRRLSSNPSKNKRSLSVLNQKNISTSRAKNETAKINNIFFDEDIETVIKDYKINQSNKSSLSPKKFIPYNRQQLLGFNNVWQSRDISNVQAEKCQNILTKNSRKKAATKKPQGSKKFAKSKLLEYLQKMDKQEQKLPQNSPEGLLEQGTMLK